MTIDEVLGQIQLRLELEAEAEHDVLEEIRGHLEEAVAEARTRGLDPQQALQQAAASFGVEEAAGELHRTHAGRGTLEGVAAAALPVLFALVLRWLIFAPDGATAAWHEMLSRWGLVVVATVAILVPLLRFPRRRYALVLWAFFWGISLVTALWPGVRR